jgi:hypothetical protein
LLFRSTANIKIFEGKVVDIHYIEAPEPYIVNFMNIKYENNSFDKITTSKIDFDLSEIFDGSIPFKSLINRAEAIVSI